MTDPKLPSEEIQKALLALRENFDKEEESVRQAQIRIWKKLEYYWNGFSRVWWNDTAHDWRVYSGDSSDDSDNGQGYYDKSINVFQAYLQSIIAALSATVPAIKCVPDDADNNSDLLTAKGGTKIASLIYKHIDAELLWVRALYVFCLSGTVFAYNYTDYDPDYGTVEVPDYEEKEEEVSQSICPVCKTPLAPEEISNQAGTDDKIETEFDPDDESVDLLHLFEGEGTLPCQQCQLMVNPEKVTQKLVVKRMVGNTKEPKARQCVEVLGGLYVKVPNYAKDLKSSPYLAYEYETHFTNVLARYPHLRKKDNKIVSSSGAPDYDRWGRLSIQYRGDEPTDTPTCKNWWIRPSAFEAIDDDKIREKLIKDYPFGAKVVWVNDEFAEICTEKLDDHWTAMINPMSDYIHFDPHGVLLTNVQDITSDLIALTLQTIEHGVPTTFADPSVLDFNAYRKAEVNPGDVIPAKAKGGKSLNDAFYQLSTATLSKEVGPFGDQVNELGQFVSGAMPSIWGGAQAGGSSRTAAQASMSRNQSLQRLQIPWKMVNVLWKNLFGKLIPAYIDTMLEDERVVKSVQGTFVNEMIARAELEGKIGSVELESSDDIPLSTAQVRDVIMGLLQTANPQLISMIFTPENMPILMDVIGINDFVIPGDKDREKQYDEIAVLLKSGPNMIPPMMGPMGPMPPQEQPTVMPDQDLDNHQVEAEICRDWLMSPTGRDAKTSNPDGVKNVMAHFRVHVQMMRMMAPPAPGPENNKPESNNGPEKPKLKEA